MFIIPSDIILQQIVLVMTIIFGSSGLTALGLHLYEKRIRKQQQRTSIKNHSEYFKDGCDRK